MAVLKRVRLWAPPHKWDGRELAVDSEIPHVDVTGDQGNVYRHVLVGRAPDGADIYALEGFVHLWEGSTHQ